MRRKNTIIILFALVLTLLIPGMETEAKTKPKLVATEPLPAKAGRFNMLLKQPKVVHAASYRYPITFILSQSYQNCSSLADLDS